MLKSLIGHRVANLVVVRLDGPSHAICQCDCGNQTRVWKSNLYRGNTKSCGCIYKTAGGLYASFQSEYDAWSGMRRRCSNPRDKAWPDYGGRGITVCEDWKSFPHFLADMGPKPNRNMSIDRINNHGNYEPSNCRWATCTEQNSNTRKNSFITINGKTQTYSAWLRETGTNPATFYYRLKRGVAPEAALSR